MCTSVDLSSGKFRDILIHLKKIYPRQTLQEHINIKILSRVHALLLNIVSNDVCVGHFVMDED